MTSLVFKMTWYLAGPMTGIPECNYPAFTAACDRLRGMGYHVVSPYETLPVKDDAQWLRCLRHDVSTLTDCDGIILLPGWSKSRGACLELHVATTLQMPVRFYGPLTIDDIS